MPDSATAVAAYTYYYPLVENLRQVNRYVTTGVGSNPATPFNTFSHARNLAGPQDTFVTINNDTVYSMAQLDLSGGPLRLTVPATGDRYYVLQFVDAWTNNIAYIGTRATGNTSGSFLIVPPGWTGTAAEPIVQASTNVVSIVGRFACTGPDDIPAVTAVQDATTITPLHPENALAGIPSPPEQADDAQQFWAEAQAWSAAFPAPQEEQELVDSFTSFWSATSDTDARRAGYAEGIAQLEEATKHGNSPVYNGWTVGLHLFDYNLYNLGLGTIDEPRWRNENQEQRILDRAIACRLGLWGNHAYEAVYAQAFTDIEQNPLVGANTYSMTFDSEPPVGAFWSITLYDIPRYYLVDNPIDRYSIGDRTAGIKYSDDRSLRIVISHAQPIDPIDLANWLPAPDAAFRLVFRLYVPGESILDGTYEYPQVLKASSEGQ
ncbi:DUF1254 domain-containing protein [Lysinibacter cavernae]|uniref:DUF1254 domain-containing protein n=1 Tax=Lysinibacter cavernae TaxID=1640652 RepID=A0A7X5QZM2_9MICO|nr:DUF1254 domain-containing protein [Lysinibacter cavernae]NIH52923.1 hypothetical protein [Lysinibacter cavernae]